MSNHDGFEGAPVTGWRDQRFLPLETGVIPLPQSIAASLDDLLSLQHPEGFWVGELEADISLESDAILLEHFLGNPRLDRVGKLANCIREEQTSEGGWLLYPGGPPHISLTVKAYFALRLAGVPESDPALQKARNVILQMGGVDAVNSFTKIYLCLFGQYDWKAVPAVPPEIVLLPPRAYFNIYEISSWSRAILVPLSIIYAFQPRRNPPAGVSLRGLFRNGKSNGNGLVPKNTALYSWKAFFHATDRLLSALERRRLTPLRRRALKKAEQWMLERLEGSDGLAAIYPAMMNSIMALDCLGYTRENPLFSRQLSEFWRLAIEEKETLRMQPCFSPVWDTALAAFAAAESGLDPAHSALRRAGEWLISKQVLKPGDWAMKNTTGRPGGWAFEFFNEPYPDVDDTAMVLLSLSRIRCQDASLQQQSMRRGLEWVMSMQCEDGGWASFEMHVNKTLLNHVPFADHNAMLDPSTPDVTGRVLEMLGAFGYERSSAPALRAIQFLRRQQEGDGSWFGRWGVNYIYGTCFALRGLAAIGEDMREAYCLCAAEWLRSIQNPDGGWGESCGSYDNPDLKGIGPSTAAQTAWALLGLFACGDFASESARNGVRFLQETQGEGGAWEDSLFTGTGFPGVFYLKYHLYSRYFPLLALSDYSRRRAPGASREKRLCGLQTVGSS